MFFIAANLKIEKFLIFKNFFLKFQYFLNL